MNGMKVIVIGGKRATQGLVALLARQGIEAAPEPRLTVGRNYAYNRFQYIRRKMREGLIHDEDC